LYTGLQVKGTGCTNCFRWELPGLPIPEHGEWWAQHSQWRVEWALEHFHPFCICLHTSSSSYASSDPPPSFVICHLSCQLINFHQLFSVSASVNCSVGMLHDKDGISENWAEYVGSEDKLEQIIRTHDRDIEKLCNAHYQGFIDSIRELLLVRSEAQDLKVRVTWPVKWVRCWLLIMNGFFLILGLDFIDWQRPATRAPKRASKRRRCCKSQESGDQHHGHCGSTWSLSSSIQNVPEIARSIDPKEVEIHFHSCASFMDRSDECFNSDI